MRIFGDLFLERNSFIHCPSDISFEEVFQKVNTIQPEVLKQALNFNHLLL